jgi:Protein of unknown function (DUF2442)
MDTKLQHIQFTQTEMHLQFRDGGICTVPLSISPRLHAATAAQRADWEIIGADRGIHWPQIDEDLSIPQLLSEYAAPLAPRARDAASPSGQPQL